MNHERSQTLLAIVACVLFFLAYNQYLSSKYQAEQLASEVAESGKNSGGDQGKARSPAQLVDDSSSNEKASELSPVDLNPIAAIKRLGSEELLLKNDVISYQFTQDYSGIVATNLFKYAHSARDDQQPVNLNDSLLIIQPVILDQQSNVSLHNLVAAHRQDSQLSFAYENGPWNVSYTYTIPESGYGFELQVDFVNMSESKKDLHAGLVMQENIISTGESGGGMFAAQNMERSSLLIESSAGLDRTDIAEYCKDQQRLPSEPAQRKLNESIAYVGFDTHYFLKVLQPRDRKFDLIAHKVKAAHSGDGCPLQVVLSERQGSIAPGDAVSFHFSGYFGPKDVNFMGIFDPRLTSSIELGWFSMVARPLLYGIKSLYSIFGNYGLAIIFITILIKLLFYPLTKAAAVSSRKMQKLQPQMTSLREKYKDDPRRQQQELMRFMQSNKINPAKGCIPILPQIPVFLALWNVLSHAIEFRHAEFALWIHDLSAADPIYVLPLVLGALMFIQQRLTPMPNMDKTQERVMMLMPVIFTAMFFSLPAGMVVYMITNTVVSILQQQWLNRRLA